jgi:hypothetical protein
MACQHIPIDAVIFPTPPTQRNINQLKSKPETLNASRLYPTLFPLLFTLSLNVLRYTLSRRSSLFQFSYNI